MKKVFAIVLLCSIVFCSCQESGKSNTDSRIAYVSEISPVEATSSLNSFANSDTTTEIFALTKESSVSYVKECEKVSVKGTDSNVNKIEKKQLKTVTSQVEESTVSVASKLTNVTESSKDKIPEKTAERVVSSKTSTSKKKQISEQKVVQKVCDLLNEHRINQGVPKRRLLPGLNKIAQFRVKQLSTDFSHEWTDEEGTVWDAAEYVAMHFKYGEYTKESETRYDATTDTVIETGKVIESYSFGGDENCGKGKILNMDNEKLAKYIVEGFKNSNSHWTSLMSEELKFDGIGLYIKNGNWYCCINSSIENYG